MTKKRRNCQKGVQNPDDYKVKKICRNQRSQSDTGRTNKKLSQICSNLIQWYEFLLTVYFSLEASLKWFVSITNH